jgi:1,4-alpha-glucan branching enzyme
MWTHPGKKLVFMGCEFGQQTEWNHDASLTWDLLDDPAHRGVQRLVRDLNRLYASEPALHRNDCTPEGFRWVIGDDTRNSVLAYLREGGQDDAPLLVILNMTPVAREAYRVGVPALDARHASVWQEMLNTDAGHYGGSGFGSGTVSAELHPSHGMDQSIVLTLPPLSALVLKRTQ